MKKKWIWIAPLAILAMALFVFLGGELVLHLWNWLLPPLFGWRRQRMDERWEKMTPEEREKFRQSWRSRCAGFAASASEPKEAGGPDDKS